MKIWLHILLVTCVLVSIANAQVPAQLEQRYSGDRDRQQRLRVQNDLLPPGRAEEPPHISRREASDLARGSYQGRVLSIRLDGQRWRVRMDEAGTVFNVFVDAENGGVLRTSE